MRFPERRKIALLVQTSSDWSRQIIQGIADYATEQGGWDFWIEFRGLKEQLKFPASWSGHGTICRLTDNRIQQSILKRRLPAVNVSWLGKHSSRIPKVISDERACATLAAEFFLKKGFRSFGYIGPDPTSNYPETILKEFRNQVETAGGVCFDFSYYELTKEADYHKQQQRLKQWLWELPKPVALLVWSSKIGREVSTVCVNHHLEIPDQVAILSIEHDPLMSALSPVPLSCINQAPHVVGYEAAKLLDQMIQGKPAPDEPTLIPPASIEERASTDTLFANDDLVREAIQFIRLRAAQEPLQVSDITQQLNVSRRILEHRFQKALHRSPASEIRQEKLKRITKLLQETNLTVSQIAVRCGFQHQEAMIRMFGRLMGMSPREYRQSIHSLK